MNNCEIIEVDVLSNDEIDLEVMGDKTIDVEVDGSGQAPGRYPPLLEKPSINGVVLIDDKTFEDLGDHTLTNIEIINLFKRVFSD